MFDFNLERFLRKMRMDKIGDPNPPLRLDRFMGMFIGPTREVKPPEETASHAKYRKERRDRNHRRRTARRINRLREA